MAEHLIGKRIHITGVVQGVGFRPFVYGLARRLLLTGWVRNTSASVNIEAEGTPEALAIFAHTLQTEAPPLARIDSIQVTDCAANGFATFEIVHSQTIVDGFQPISPDVSICPDCLHELFDPTDRRHRYPFINCTNCGPRFTIIEAIPYDRPQTTMASFPMCQDCSAEFHDPQDRRFHAQPVACSVCGPQVWLEVSNQRSATSGRSSAVTKAPSPSQNSQSISGEAAVQATRLLLRKGKIVAIKGLGGFHLACDATNPEAVAELRRRKLRVDKPFAVMMPDLAAVERHCLVNEAERELLESRERPIVVVPQQSGTTVTGTVAPNQKTLGVMLPYTPLHYLLAQSEQESDFPEVLVLTSGNVSEEPIAFDNDEARERLARMADAFLLHDRGIRTRCDDAVVRVVGKEVYPLRRSRGYAPFPVRLPWKVPPLLATGAELKNTFCVTREQYGFLSHHIGDMENYETLSSFEDGVAHFERLFRIRPEALVYDLHPDYLTTRYALERAEREGLPAIGVQHHHAHIAACMAEHGHPGDRPVIGVAFDGTGYGDDGTIWGGEFLLSDYSGYSRVGHLDYIPLPGGDKAVRQPWRLALAWLHQAGQDWDSDLPPVQTATPEARRVISCMVGGARQAALEGAPLLNSPLTSSMGRLFDAVSALAGVRQVVNYEAQAAIELEALVEPREDGAYPFAILGDVIDPTPLFQAVVTDLRSREATSKIAARFHNGVAVMVLEKCQQLRQRFDLSEVALSGGVWQNMALLKRTLAHLRQDGFSVYLHREVPSNDGGLALGQAAVAAFKLGEVEK